MKLALPKCIKPSCCERMLSSIANRSCVGSLFTLAAIAKLCSCPRVGVEEVFVSSDTLTLEHAEQSAFIHVGD